MRRYNYMTQEDLNFKKILAILELGSAIGLFCSTNVDIKFEDFMKIDDEEIC